MASLSLNEKLEALPPENDNSYPFQVRKIIAELDDPGKDFSEIIKNEEFTEKTRFNAFYGALAHLWMEREFKKYRQLIDQYENIFSHHLMFYCFKSQYYICSGKSLYNLQLALGLASEAKKRGPNLPNVLHLFTSVIVELAELSEKQIEKRLLVEAEDSINKAIAISKGNYAKYFATKANLLGNMGRIEEAKQLIQQAIEIEPADSTIYALRLGDYQEIRLKLNFLEYKHQIQKKEKESIERLEESRLRTIELLGILSAIIAFLITSIQVGKNFIFEEAARLMIISGGVVLIIFSAYSVIFFRAKPRVSQLFILLFGLVIIYLFGFHF